MSTPSSPLAALFRECERRGIDLLIDADGGLTIDGPEDAMTPELLELLIARKKDILIVLYAEESWDDPDPYPYEWG